MYIPTKFKFNRHVHRTNACRILEAFLSLLLSLSVFASVPDRVHAADFVYSPTTSYASGFKDKCEGQQWFINEIERLLNQQGKTLNTITSQYDLNDIYALGFAGMDSITTIPRAIGELKNLRHLFLSNNRITTIPAELYTLPNLETLDLSNNRITGSLSPSLANLTKLEVLSLWGNRISGAIIPVITSMTSLTNLDLSYNQLTGEIPAGISNLDNLLLFSASNNQLSGTLPPSLSGCDSLKALILWNNNLSGEIPAAYGSFLRLELLDLAGNSLSGSIPSELGGLTNLKELSLRGNQLTGTIPGSFAGLVNLEILDLNANTLSGNIPTGLAALIHMRKIDLSMNQFTGTLPDIFIGMSDLQWAHLHSNRLTGQAPDSLFDAQKNGADVDMHSNYMTGDTLKKIVKNADNFVDFAGTMQNYLYLPPYIQVPINTQIDAYALLVHKDSKTNLVNPAKAKLPLSGYACELISTNPNAADYVTLTTTATGFIIKTLKEIKLAEGIEFELRIVNNDGSVYSRTRFKITTDVPPVIPDPTPTPAPATPTPVPTPDSSQTPGGTGYYPYTPESPSPSQTPAPTIAPGQALIPYPPLDIDNFHGSAMSGYPDKTFRPDNLTTRAEAVQLLFNIIDMPDKEQAFTATGFTDIAASHWSAKAVHYLSVKNILTIFGNDTLNPTQSITRGEFIALVMRCLGPAAESGAGENAGGTLSDVTGHVYESYIRAAVSLRFITGYPDGTFQPNRSITRAEITVIINRLQGHNVQKGDFERIINPFTDITPAHWAYDSIMEATIPHYMMKDSEGNEYRRFTN